MNKTELVEIVKTLNESASSQLCKYAYTELFYVILILLLFFVLLLILCKKAKKIEDYLGIGRDSHFVQTVVCVALAVLFICFLVFANIAIHVATTPELEAIRMIIGSQG